MFMLSFASDFVDTKLFLVSNIDQRFELRNAYISVRDRFLRRIREISTCYLLANDHILKTQFI